MRVHPVQAVSEGSGVQGQISDLEDLAVLPDLVSGGGRDVACHLQVPPVYGGGLSGFSHISTPSVAPPGRCWRSIRSGDYLVQPMYAEDLAAQAVSAGSQSENSGADACRLRSGEFVGQRVQDRVEGVFAGNRGCLQRARGQH